MPNNLPPDDDNEAWQTAAREFRPLKKTSAKVTPDIPKSGKNIKINPPTPMRPTPLSFKGEVTIGDKSQIDGSIARKLKTGTYPIDFKLDLHGKTQDEAFAAIRYAIETGYSTGKRCILVITGKGVQGAGILREQLPRWLNTNGLREYILAINPASPNHGGSGAFYVLLRKNSKI